MSIVGSFAKSVDYRPSDVVSVLTSLTEKQYLPPHCWRDRVINLACCSDATLAHISVPCSDGGKHDLVVAVWGRLDNRQNLSRELPAPALLDSDADLLLNAYLRWGINFLDRVAGDFCCAVYDGRQRRLLLGRDFLGRRPLVYHDSPQALHFASEQSSLWAISGVAKEIDEDSLAEWFAKQPRPESRTFHKNICRVQPGHILIVDDNGMCIHRYWRPEELPILHFRHGEEYSEALLATLDEAVSCRLPAIGAVASSLSAGLDSPSVTALAARQLARQGRTLTAFTAVPQAGFDAKSHYPGRLCNEGHLAASLAEMYPNIDHVLIPNNSIPLLEAIKTGVQINNSPNLGGINVTWFQAMLEKAKSLNASVFLTGQAGNVTISYDGRLLSSILSNKLSYTSARELLALHREGSSRISLAWQIISPFLPPFLFNAIRILFGRKKKIDSVYDLSCINPHFARESGVEERFQRQGIVQSHADNTDSRSLRLYKLGKMDSGIATAANWRRHGFYLSDPTADKRVVELCLSIPNEQYLWHGEPRSLIRRAMSGILPPEILANRRKGLQSADWTMTLMAQLPEMRVELDLLKSSPLAQYYLNLERMHMLLEKLPKVNHREREAISNYSGLVRSFVAGVFIRQIESESE